MLQSTLPSSKYAFYEPQSPSKPASPICACKYCILCSGALTQEKGQGIQAGSRGAEARVQGGHTSQSHDPSAPIEHRQKRDRGGPQKSIPLAGSKRSAGVNHSLPLLGLLLGWIQVSLPSHRPKHGALFHVQPITNTLPSLRRVSPFLERR